MNETVKAWALLLMVVFVIVVAILFGWPHYKRYTAKLSVQTEIDVADMRALATDRRSQSTGKKP